MEKLKRHYHCLICERPHKIKKAAEECFKNHNEREHLRWVAQEVIYMKSRMYDLMKHIDWIKERYKIEE